MGEQGPRIIRGGSTDQAVDAGGGRSVSPRIHGFPLEFLTHYAPERTPNSRVVVDVLLHI